MRVPGRLMEANGLDRVLVRLPDELVEITSEERDFLLEQLVFVADSKTIREKLEVGASRPVTLDKEQRSGLLAALVNLDNDVWLPDGIGRLLDALDRAPESIADSADR